MAEKTPKISGIILAAGSSSRMGKTKQLLSFGGRALLAPVVESARSSLLWEVILVLGHEAEAIRRSLALEGITVCINSVYKEGMSTSIRTGLKVISPDAQAALFLLGDQPLVTGAVIDALIGEYSCSRAPIVLPVWQGKRGNPVLIDQSLFPRLVRLTGDTGARALFPEMAGRIREVEMADEAVCLDVDTWEDYLRLTGGNNEK